jgi:protein disulfide-isomerase A1
MCFVGHADGEFNRIPLHEFVFANKLPLVINFTRETASSIFESDVKRQVS